MFESVKSGDLYIIKENGEDVRTVARKRFVTRYEGLANAVARDMNKFGPDPRKQKNGRDSLVALLCSYCDFYHVGKEKLIQNLLCACSPEYDGLLYCRIFCPGLLLPKLIPTPPVSPEFFKLWNDSRNGQMPISKIAYIQNVCEDNLKGGFSDFLQRRTFRQLMAIQLCRAVTTSVYLGYLLVSKSVSCADLGKVVEDLMSNGYLGESGYYPDRIPDLTAFLDSALYFSAFPDEQV